MSKRTPLYDAHLAAGARMVDFGGWEMPINYGSQIEEHNKVRQAAGMFDVSHMTVVDIKGPQARHFLGKMASVSARPIYAPNPSSGPFHRSSPAWPASSCRRPSLFVANSWLLVAGPFMWFQPSVSVDDRPRK